jgi:hypothetical protein
VATPFVQGRLLERDLGCAIETVCAVSGRPIRFSLDSELQYSVHPPCEHPIVVVPLIDLPNLDAPCIVDDF